MSINRYIAIKAVKVNNEELIPFFDPRLMWAESEDYGDKVTINGSSKEYSNFVDCNYDLKTHAVIPGIEKEIFPELDKMEYKIGETVLVERDHRTMQQTKIMDVVFEEFETDFRLGKKLEPLHIRNFFTADEEIKMDAVYVLKEWHPTYVLQDGLKTRYSHKLKHVFQEELSTANKESEKNG